MKEQTIMDTMKMSRSIARFAMFGLLLTLTSWPASALDRWWPSDRFPAKVLY